MAREKPGHLAQGRFGADGHQVARHDVGGGLDIRAVARGLDLGGRDQAGQVLDAQVHRLAIADKDVRQFLLGQAQTLDGRGIGCAVRVRLVELAEGIAAARGAGVKHRDQNQQRRAGGHRHQREAQAQGRDPLGPHRHRHGDGPARGMRRPAQRHDHDGKAHRQRHAKQRAGHEAADQDRRHRGHGVADDGRPGLRQRAVRRREQQDRRGPEGRDQVDAQPQVGREGQRASGRHRQPQRRAQARPQRLAQGNRGDRGAEGAKSGMGGWGHGAPHRKMTQRGNAPGGRVASLSGRRTAAAGAAGPLGQAACTVGDWKIPRGLSPQTGNAVDCSTTLSAKEDCICATPGSRARCWRWMRAKSSVSAASTFSR